MKSSMPLILLGLLVVGCGNPQPPQSKTNTTDKPSVKITTENQRGLFPFAEGNRWVYDVEITRQLVGQGKQVTTGEMEYRVSKVIAAVPTTKAVISVYQDGVKKDEQEWGVDDKGIYQMSIRKDHIAYTPKQPVLKFPIKDQEEFKWDGRGLTPIGKMGRMQYAYKQDGMQTADTGMGSMNCVYMQSGGNFKHDDGSSGDIAVNAWFAPGVGLARYRQGVVLKQGTSVITLRLKSYTVKK